MRETLCHHLQSIIRHVKQRSKTSGGARGDRGRGGGVLQYTTTWPLEFFGSYHCPGGSCLPCAQPTGVSLVDVTSGLLLMTSQAQNAGDAQTSNTGIIG